MDPPGPPMSTHQVAPQQPQKAASRKQAKKQIRLQLLPSEIRPGTRIQAKFRRSSKFYKGRVFKKNPDGKTYDVMFDDGDRDRKVARKSIKGCERTFCDGESVVTPYGPGVVRSMRWEDMMYEIVLDQWQLASAAEVVVYLQDDQLQLHTVDWVSIFSCTL